MDDNAQFALKLKEDLVNRFCQFNDKTHFKIITDNFSHVSLNKHYDIAFLDVDLKNYNGILVAKDLKQKRLCKIIIFVSSHANLVYDSLVVQPYFFLRKNDYNKDLEILFSLIEDLFHEKNLMILKYQRLKQTIEIDNIIYVEILNRCLTVHTVNGVFEDQRTLRVFLDEVDQSKFVQIHKSYVINMDYLLQCSSNEVRLIGNVILNIGRVFKRDFVKKYKAYIIK